MNDDTLHQEFDDFCAKLALKTGEHEASIRRLGLVFFQGGYKSGLSKSKSFLDDIVQQAEDAMQQPLQIPKVEIGSLLRQPSYEGDTEEPSAGEQK